MLELLRISVKYIIAAVLVSSGIIIIACTKVAGNTDYRDMKMREKEGGLDQ